MTAASTYLLSGLSKYVESARVELGKKMRAAGNDVLIVFQGSSALLPAFEVVSVSPAVPASGRVISSSAEPWPLTITEKDKDETVGSGTVSEPFETP